MSASNLVFATFNSLKVKTSHLSKIKAKPTVVPEGCQEPCLADLHYLPLSHTGGSQAEVY